MADSRVREAATRVANVLRAHAAAATAIVAWFCVTSIVVLLNKYIYVGYAFNYPLTLSLMHMTACTLATLAMVHAPERLRAGWKLAPLSWRDRVLRVGPLSAAIGLSIAAGNEALLWIPVALSQTIGATRTVFVVLLSSLIRTRHPWQTYAFAAWITVGVALATFGDAQFSFHIFGIVMALVQTLLGALKTVMQALLLIPGAPAEDGSVRAHVDPLSLLYYSSPLAAAVLVPLALFVEARKLALDEAILWGWPLFALLAVSAATAVLFNLLTYVVTFYTSDVIFQFLGNARTALVIVLSIALFATPVTPLNIVGVAVTFAGVAAYSAHEALAKQRRKQQAYVQLAEEGGGGGGGGGGGNGGTVRRSEGEDVVESDNDGGGSSGGGQRSSPGLGAPAGVAAGWASPLPGGSAEPPPPRVVEPV